MSMREAKEGGRPRVKRKLSRKQLAAGFGGKRRQHAQHVTSKIKSGSRKHTTTHKAASKKKKSTSSTSGIPTGIKAAIVAALVVVLAISGIEVEKWIVAHGGWLSAYQAWKAGGLPGIMSWASAAQVGGGTGLPGGTNGGGQGTAGTTGMPLGQGWNMPQHDVMPGAPVVAGVTAGLANPGGGSGSEVITNPVPVTYTVDPNIDPNNPYPDTTYFGL